MIRQPHPAEMDAIYRMGYDVWGDGDDISTHLNDCRSSEKYAAGDWFVWDLDGQPVASLIVFHQRYRLPEHCFGLGAVATEPAFRRRGYASALIEAVVAVLAERQAQAIYLHSDIDPAFYQRLGFQPIGDNPSCLRKDLHPSFRSDVVPDYF